MSTALTLSLKHPLAVLEQSLDSYLQAVRSIPVLSVEQERELAERWRQHEDLEAARQLVLSHLRFVVYIAQGYKGYGLPQADLVQEGNIGLMKAVKRFDPGMGVRLVSFAVHWIRAEIHEFILRNWRIVKVATTKAQRKLFFNLRSLKTRMGWLSHEEVENMARDLGVTTRDVREMEKRLGTSDVSFDPPAESDDEEAGFSPAAYLEDQRYDPARMVEDAEWETQSQAGLSRAIAKLDPRSRDILQKRWLNEEKATLQALAEEYKVSAERIRQIENSALQKLKKHMEAGLTA